ncbi:MAG: hypothetical protein QNJ34_25890 [Xenococcaceae cyanobacterium MO_188.B29]|nr:hypothetical protein [Xenococcaceae cyanobacterium MO_188.B29]
MYRFSSRAIALEQERFLKCDREGICSAARAATASPLAIVLSKNLPEKIPEFFPFY